MMKILIFLAFLLSGDTKEELSQIIFQDYINTISKTNEGKKIVEIVKRDDIKVYFEYSDDRWLAWYEPYGKVFFNLKYLMIFFDIEDYDYKRIERVLRVSNKVREEFVNYTDFLFVHELVHHIQHKKYKNLAKYRKEFVEFEYEAFMTMDIYFFEKIKKNKKFFNDVISKKYYDLYTDYAVTGFISSLNYYDKYLEEINKRYLQEISGYVSLKEIERKKKIKLEEKKILSYASGQKKIYEFSKKEYEKIKKTMDNYFLDLKTNLLKKWEIYVADALIFVNKSSYEVKNYELFWRSCYFLKELFKRDCHNDNLMVDSFINHLSADINPDYIVEYVKEIYWYKKVFQNKFSYMDSLVEKIIKDAILYCDKIKNNECLEKIDEIVITDLIK